MSTTTTQPTQTPFALIEEKLRKAIEQYKKNHPKKHREYEEFSQLFDALKSEKFFDIKNINKTFDEQGCHHSIHYYHLTLLQFAVLLDSKELVQDIIGCGAKVNFQRANGLFREGSALHFAAATGNVAIFQLLIDAGGEVNIKTWCEGETPLHHAVQHRHADMVQCLLQHGARVNEKNDSGSAPLHLAAMSGYQGIAKILLKHGAMPNEQNHLGLTPLHFVAMFGYQYMVPTLLARGANPYIRDNIGQTAFDYAQRNNYIGTFYSLFNYQPMQGLTKLALRTDDEEGGYLDNIDKNHSESTMKSISKNSESSETAKVEDSLPQDQAEVEEESATSSSVPGATPPESQESKSNDDGFIGSILKWLRLPPISGEEEAEIIPFDANVDKGKVVEEHYVVMPGQGAFAESSDN